MSKVIDYISGCGGGKFTWTVKTTNFDINKSYGYFIDTSNTPITATVPQNAEIGDAFYIVDSTGALDESNKLVINHNGHNIMGFQDNLEITEKYMSLYMVYADASKGWVIADGKGCNEDSAGGEISADRTIYLAPSASNQSPAGVAVGSDITGDGSIAKPFFSIKRAMDYLENYRIKIGVSVTIHGLPGKYYYNDNHTVEVKHKDAKYINIKFGMLETGNYHETTVTTDAVNVTNNTDHDLIEFTVDDIGTGFYQIQAGDYIKIYADNSYLQGDDFSIIKPYSVWQGYYKVMSVDSLNKKVTIIFKRHQSGGSYYSNNTYILPSTPLNSNAIHVIKCSTHIFMEYTNTYIEPKLFFRSDFGFGELQLIASDEYYYNNGYHGFDFIQVYDGVLNNVNIIVSGFNNALYFKNLELNWLDNTDIQKTFSTFTSCDTPILLEQCKSVINFISINNSNNGLFSKQTILIISGYYSITITNNYSSAVFGLKGGSLRIMRDDLLQTRFICICGINVISSYYCDSFNFSKCLLCNGYYGIGIYSTTTESFISGVSDLTNVLQNHIIDNYYGIYSEKGPNIYLKNIVIKNNNIGVYVANNGYLICNGLKNDISYNTTINIKLADSISNILDTKCTNSTYGIYLSGNSFLLLYYNQTNNKLENNSSYDIKCYIGSRVHIHSKYAIQSTSPAKNTTPLYNNYTEGTYIIETTY